MNRRAQFLIYVLVAGVLTAAQAHESRPAYLEINETTSGRYDVLWRTPVNAGMRLPILLRFPEDARNVTEPNIRELPDSLVERRIIKSDGSLVGKRIEFVGLEATITDVLARVHLLNGSESTTLVHPSKAWVEVTGSQGFASVAGSYSLLGIEHILFGIDHLLFVLALLMITNGTMRLLKIEVDRRRHRVLAARVSGGLNPSSDVDLSLLKTLPKTPRGLDPFFNVWRGGFRLLSLFQRTADDFGLRYLPPGGKPLESMSGRLIQGKSGAMSHRRHTITHTITIV